VRVPYDEGVAIHIGPESCAVGREAAREALTGARNHSRADTLHDRWVRSREYIHLPPAIVPHGVKSSSKTAMSASIPARRLPLR
jgi:hypothetical protein